jgi:hypothetical protein
MRRDVLKQVFKDLHGLPRRYRGGAEVSIFDPQRAGQLGLLLSHDLLRPDR